MKNKVDLSKYQEFVESVTSHDSDEMIFFLNRIESLEDHRLNDDQKINVPLLLCGAIGLGSETGEFQEIVKKITFQRKPLNEEALFHMKRELGDIIWYWVNACRALNLDPNEVILENVEKLSSRYPDGKFDVWYSENRKEGDL